MESKLKVIVFRWSTMEISEESIQLEEINMR